LLHTPALHRGRAIFEQAIAARFARLVDHRLVQIGSHHAAIQVINIVSLNSSMRCARTLPSHTHAIPRVRKNGKLEKSPSIFRFQAIVSGATIFNATKDSAYFLHNFSWE
jgi:hypothetical protein